MLSFGAKSSKKSLKSVMKFEKLVLFFLPAHGLYMQEHKRELLGVTIFNTPEKKKFRASRGPLTEKKNYEMKRPNADLSIYICPFVTIATAAYQF